MFLAKIKDKFMFKGHKNYSHWYLVYTRKNRVLYMKQITHLYKPDKNRFDQIGIGLLEKRKITSFDTPQGVKKRKIYKNGYGKKISLYDVYKNSDGIRNNVRTRKYK